MNIKVRNIPKGGRKGTTKLENLPEFCITMYGADREVREGLMTMLDGLGVRWTSKRSMFESDGAQGILDGTHWLFLALGVGMWLVRIYLGARSIQSTST